MKIKKLWGLDAKKHLSVFSKLRAVLHITVARKIAETVSSIKIDQD